MQRHDICTSSFTYRGCSIERWVQDSLFSICQSRLRVGVLLDCRIRLSTEVLRAYRASTVGIGM